MSSIKIVYKNINDLIEYKNNPRNNNGAVKEVAESIKNYGFKVPIVIDKNNVIVCGHTRVKASKLLNINEIPCIVADDLNEEELNAFRLVDNRVSEFSNWDYEKLKEELKNIDDNFIEQLKFIEELDVNDDDFIKDTEITKEKEEKILICPKCGERL